MNRLRTRLILVFVLATTLPLGLTIWTSLALLERSLRLAPLAELDHVSQSLQKTGRELYKNSEELLKRDAAEGKVEPRHLTPAEAQDFWDSGKTEWFELAGNQGDRIDYYVRRDKEVLVYSRPMGIAMDALATEYAGARDTFERSAARDLRRGFSSTLLVVAAALWLAALATLIFLAARISRPIRQLTQGLGRVAAGDLGARVEPGGSDEIGAALHAFNHMAGQLQQAREHLIHVTRLASWQALARKMAHELKNSLTPIRLTVEEIVARQTPADQRFLERAAQVVVDEVTGLERRLRAFSEFAMEPPTHPAALDVNGLLEERIRFLRVAHPDVAYSTRFAETLPHAWADADQVKGILTNLLENAADAAGRNGRVLGITGVSQGKILVEVHDSGPGLSEEARGTLFEPSISFKKHGMGLGLSISRKNALLAGGDLETIEGLLGGAGFRLLLPLASQ